MFYCEYVVKDTENISILKIIKYLLLRGFL